MGRAIKSKKPGKKNIVRTIIRYTLITIALMLFVLLLLITFLLSHLNINHK